MDHQKATRRGRAGCKHARGGKTVHIADICDGAEFARFLGQTIAAWCRSSGLGFAFTLNDTDMAENTRCHFSKIVSHRAHHQPAGSKATVACTRVVAREESRCARLFSADFFAHCCPSYSLANRNFLEGISRVISGSDSAL